MTTTINNEHKKLNVPNKREQNQTCLDSAERQGLRPKGNVPNLRFPEFVGEWEKRTIGEISTIKNGPFGSVLHADDYVDEGIPIVTTEHFKNGNLPLSKNGIPQVSEDDYYRLRGYKLEKDDIVFSRVGSIDINAHVEQPQQGWLFSGRVLRVRPIKSVNSLCLHYILSTESVKRSIRNRAVGQTMPSINTPILSNTKINIPQSVGEQKKIANLLALLDERIATQNKIIEDLKKLKSAIIEKVFNGKHSEKLQLNDVGSYIRGLTYSSNDVVEHGGTIVMRSNNIINGSLLDYNNNVVFVNKQMSAELQLQNGDVVICMANGSSSLVGKSSFYDGSCHSTITIGAFCGIYRSKEPIVKWLFQTNKYRRYIWNSLQGGNGAIANLNGEDILNMSFSVPNAPIKDTCVKMLTSVDSALENNMSLCALYTLQKQHLLRQMFI